MKIENKIVYGVLTLVFVIMTGGGFISDIKTDVLGGFVVGYLMAVSLTFIAMSIFGIKFSFSKKASSTSA